jgi:hypothetical protein
MGIVYFPSLAGAETMEVVFEHPSGGETILLSGERRKTLNADGAFSWNSNAFVSGRSGNYNRILLQFTRKARTFKKILCH